MAAWCLPPKLANAFLDAVKSGELDPGKLMDLSSPERRALFGKYVGEENAAEVNAQFESKMLLADQKRGMATWASKVAGLTEPARRDIIAQINKLDRILQPEEEKAFLADLAAKKLGVSVTADEARTIYTLSQRAEQLRSVAQGANATDADRIAYGRAVMDLTDGIESLKPEGQTYVSRMIDILSIPKSALTSILHFSAPFVQGWGMLSTKNAWAGFGKMFQYFADEENYKNLNAWIISHPEYETARQAKLGLTKLGDKLSAREEAIQSTLVEQANQWLSDRTGVPNLVRASSRSFTGYLNYVRFSRYADLIRAARLAGEDVRPGSQAAKDIANVVNNFTGRGPLGPNDYFQPVGPALNAVFFAPRKVAATVQMFNPYEYLKPQSATARKAAIRQITGSLVATSAVLSIAKAMGASVDPDPRSSDFAKIVVNGEKLDLTGGNEGYLRLLARVASGQEITSSGKLVTLGEKFGSPNRASLIGTYIRGKLSPVAALMTDALIGTDPIGRQFSVTQEARDKLTPIFLGSIIGEFQNDPNVSVDIFPAMAGLFGVGVEAPLPPMSRNGLDAWGNELPWAGGTPKSWHNDPVNQEMERIGYTPKPPMDTIRGVKLTDAQYDDYARTSGRLAHMRLEGLVQMPAWDQIPTAQRLSTVRSVVSKARDMAATQIMLQSQGSDNDIVKQATAAKMAKAAEATPEPAAQ